MTFYATTNVMDKGLEWIKDNAQFVSLCTTEPDNYAEIATTTITGIALASGVSPGGTSFRSAIANPADGSSKGRVLTIPLSSELQVFHDDTGTHVAIGNETSSVLMYVTELATNRAVTTADKVNIPAWTITIRPPTSS